MRPPLHRIFLARSDVNHVYIALHLHGYSKYAMKGGYSEHLILR